MNLDYYEDADIQQFQTMQDLIEPAYPMDVRIFEIWRFRPHVNAFKRAINNPDACDLIKFKDQYTLAKSIADKYAGKTLNVAIIYYEVALFAFNKDKHKKVIVPDILFVKPKPINAQLLYTDLSDQEVIIESIPSEHTNLDFSKVERRALSNYQKNMNAVQQWNNGIRSYISGDQLRACQGQTAKEAPSLYADLGDEDDKPEIKEEKSKSNTPLGDLFSYVKPSDKKPKFDAKQFADKKENGLSGVLSNLFRKK